MDKLEIKEYRQTLEKEYIEKDHETETSLYYTAFGALAFVLTINREFVKLFESKYKVLLILSIISLFSSLVLIFFRRHRTKHYDNQLMRFIDNSKDLEEKKFDSGLLDEWMKSDKELSGLIISIYYTMGVGIFFEIAFFIINIYKHV